MMRTLGRGHKLGITLKNAVIHQYVIVARNLVKSGRLCPTLIAKITSLVGIVKSSEVIVVNVFARKNIGDEFED